MPWKYWNWIVFDRREILYLSHCSPFTGLWLQNPQANIVNPHDVLACSSRCCIWVLELAERCVKTHVTRQLPVSHLRSLRTSSDYNEILDEVTHQKLAPDLSTKEEKTMWSTAEISHNKLIRNSFEISDIRVVRKIQFWAHVCKHQS